MSTLTLLWTRSFPAWYIRPPFHFVGLRTTYTHQTRTSPLQVARPVGNHKFQTEFQYQTLRCFWSVKPGSLHSSKIVSDLQKTPSPSRWTKAIAHVVLSADFDLNPTSCCYVQVQRGYAQAHPAGIDVDGRGWKPSDDWQALLHVAV